MERRGQLLEAAIRYALKEGLAEASVRHIAEEANVSLGVVHYCYRSKDELITAMAGTLRDQQLAPVVAAIDETTGSPAHIIDVTKDALWQTLKESPGRQLLVYELMAWSVRGDGAAANELLNGYTARIEQVLRDRLGVDDTDPAKLRQAARMLLAILDGLVLAWLADRDDEQFLTLLSLLGDLVLSSFAIPVH